MEYESLSERTGGHYYNGFGPDREATSLFNAIKDTYAKKIDELNDLKRQVFLLGKDEALDHHSRSKLRIQIESLLIDLNEEVFALSEELAKSYGHGEPRGTALARAREFEQRMLVVMRRVREEIDDNHSVRLVRRHAKIASTSP